MRKILKSILKDDAVGRNIWLVLSVAPSKADAFWHNRETKASREVCPMGLPSCFCENSAVKEHATNLER